MRWATALEQIINRRPMPSQTGYQNIYLTPGGRYKVQLHILKKFVYIGTFTTLEKAIKARDLAFARRREAMLYGNKKRNFEL